MGYLNGQLVLESGFCSLVNCFIYLNNQLALVWVLVFAYCDTKGKLFHSLCYDLLFRYKQAIHRSSHSSYHLQVVKWVIIWGHIPSTLTKSNTSKTSHLHPTRCPPASCSRAIASRGWSRIPDHAPRPSRPEHQKASPPPRPRPEQDSTPQSP